MPTLDEQTDTTTDSPVDTATDSTVDTTTDSTPDTATGSAADTATDPAPGSDASSIPVPTDDSSQSAGSDTAVESDPATGSDQGSDAVQDTGTEPETGVSQGADPDQDTSSPTPDGSTDDAPTSEASSGADQSGESTQGDSDASGEADTTDGPADGASSSGNGATVQSTGSTQSAGGYQTTSTIAAGASAAPARPYTTKSWTSLVDQLRGDIPLDFILRWIDIESAGNPCAFGNANAKGPDGNPLEMGLGQLYNPDDFRTLGINSSGWRAYCQIGTQTVTRDLTPDECKSQVAGLISLIGRCRTVARQFNPGWNETSPDFQALTKTCFNLPGLVKGMPAVTKKLGRPPASFTEFSHTVVTVTLDANTMKYAASFARELNNAAKTGGVGA